MGRPAAHRQDPRGRSARPADAGSSRGRPEAGSHPDAQAGRSWGGAAVDRSSSPSGPLIAEQTQ